MRINIMWATDMFATLGVSRSLIAPLPVKHGSGLSRFVYTDATDLPPRGAPV